LPDAQQLVASYGSLARFRDLRRMHEIGKYTIVGASGEYSDYQFILHDLEDLM
jgi:20S proteasome subunit beta 7